MYGTFTQTKCSISNSVGLPGTSEMNLRLNWTREDKHDRKEGSSISLAVITSGNRNVNTWYCHSRLLGKLKHAINIDRETDCVCIFLWVWACVCVYVYVDCLGLHCTSIRIQLCSLECIHTLYILHVVTQL